MTTTARPRRTAPRSLGAALLAATLALPGLASARATAAGVADDGPAFRAALLREGSRIDRAEAVVELDERAGAWRVEIEGPDEDDPPHRLVVLPSGLLAELERIVDAVRPRRRDGAAEATGEEMQRLRFRLSGLVTVFRRTNYLLLTHPPTLLGPADAPGDAGATDETTGATSAAEGASPGDDAPTVADDAGDVDAILRELDAAVGPVARRTGAPRSEDRRPVGGLIREGTRLVDRRGTIVRTAGGGFRLVLDSSDPDAPPMLILPCGLLDALARVAERPGEGAAVLVTGEVYAYGGRNYLLPTVYRRPNELTALTPVPSSD